VPVPIVAYFGLTDPTVRADAVRAWSELTAVRFELVSFPGGHFFIESDVDIVLTDLAGRLAA